MNTKPALVLATGNADKVKELRQILAPLLPELKSEQIVPMSHFGVPSPQENALTFEGNALIKSRTVAQATGLPAVADDSGITVDALGGAPGVFSARWCGKHGDDAANMNLLLAQLIDVMPSDRAARFVCAAALSVPNSYDTCVLGTVAGHLAFEPCGNQGFGYDPIFIPNGHDVTAAQLSASQKNGVSHRARAFTALAPKIREVLF